VTVVISQGSVDEHHIRLHRTRFLERRGGTVHRRDDLQIRLLGQHGALAHGPHQLRVIPNPIPHQPVEHLHLLGDLGGHGFEIGDPTIMRRRA